MTTTRRGFLGAVGAGAALGVLPVVPALEVRGAAAPAHAGVGVAPLEAAKRWYEAMVDSVVRAWEPRFRFRQYRPDEEDSEDWEGREAPRDELYHTLSRLPVLQDEARAHLVLAASAQGYDDGPSPTYCAAEVMSLDMLAHAESLGYFASPCPEDLRFPDLPGSGYLQDDFQSAAREIESARSCASTWKGIAELEAGRGRPDPEAEVKADEFAAKVVELEARVAGMRDGKVPAFTQAQKEARHAERRREIVRAYAARLEAAGHDASWVDVAGAGGRFASEEVAS